MMQEQNKPGNTQQGAASDQKTNQQAKNPFDNQQSVEQDLAQSQDELEKEQQFKDASTERD